MKYQNASKSANICFYVPIKVSLKIAVLMFVILFIIGIFTLIMPNNQVTASASSPVTSPTPRIVPPRNHPIPPVTPRPQPALSRSRMGMPAIKPRADLANSSTRFTEEDAKQYAFGYPGFLVDKSTVPASQQIVVDRVQFMTSKQVTALLKDIYVYPEGTPDATLACVVTLHNILTLTTVVPGTANSHRVGYMVFDALTGNLLLIDYSHN